MEALRFFIQRIRIYDSNIESFYWYKLGAPFNTHYHIPSYH